MHTCTHTNTIAIFFLCFVCFYLSQIENSRIREHKKKLESQSVEKRFSIENSSCSFSHFDSNCEINRKIMNTLTIDCEYVLIVVWDLSKYCIILLSKYEKFFSFRFELWN